MEVWAREREGLFFVSVEYLTVLLRLGNSTEEPFSHAVEQQLLSKHTIKPLMVFLKNKQWPIKFIGMAQSPLLVLWGFATTSESALSGQLPELHFNDSRTLPGLSV